MESLNVGKMHKDLFGGIPKNLSGKGSKSPTQRRQRMEAIMKTPRSVKAK